MPSIFTRIIQKEIPCFKIAENDSFLAFLDINPLKEGHALVIPKKEVDYLFDLDDETYQELFNYSKKIAAAIKKVVPCNRIGVAVIGLEVPHAHVHLVPIDRIADMDFKKERVKLSSAEFSKLANEIASHL